MRSRQRGPPSPWTGSHRLAVGRRARSTWCSASSRVHHPSNQTSAAVEISSFSPCFGLLAYVHSVLDSGWLPKTRSDRTHSRRDRMHDRHHRATDLSGHNPPGKKWNQPHHHGKEDARERHQKRCTCSLKPSAQTVCREHG